MGFGAGSDGQPVEVAQFFLERPGSKEDVSGASQFVEPRALVLGERGGVFE